MRMKKMSFLILSMVLALAVLPAIPGRAAQDKTTESVWTSQPLKIDGAAKEWEGAALAEWENGGVGYAFRNDGQNLYVLFIIKDSKLRSTIEEVGITLYVDAEGNKKKDYGIHFQKKRITAEESIALLEKEGPVSEDQKAQIRSKPYYNYYASEVVTKKTGLSPVPPGVLPAMFKYASQQKSLVYEFAVPLNRIQDNAAGIGAQPGATVTIGFEWGGPTEEQRKAIAKARGDRSNIANETDLGRSTDITAGARGIDRLPPKHSFWSTVRLAKAGA
jgi:hypothetical protein